MLIQHRRPLHLYSVHPAVRADVQKAAGCATCQRRIFLAAKFEAFMDRGRRACLCKP